MKEMNKPKEIEGFTKKINLDKVELSKHILPTKLYSFQDKECTYSTNENKEFINNATNTSI